MVKRKGIRRSRSRSGSSNSKGNLIISALSSVGYGLLREPIAQKIPPFMGKYTDEIVLGGVAAAGVLFGGSKIKAASLPVVCIELAQVTEKIKSQFSNGNTTSVGLVYY